MGKILTVKRNLVLWKIQVNEPLPWIFAIIFKGKWKSIYSVWNSDLKGLFVEIWKLVLQK